MADSSATSIEITDASYGKDEIRVLSRLGTTVRDLTLTLDAEGEFLGSFRSGDNSAVLPTDTLRRHALAECGRMPSASAEQIVDAIALRLLDANPAFTTVTAEAVGTVWEPAGSGCYRAAAWRPSARVRRTRAGGRQASSGLRGLAVLTTSGSAFTGFLRDALTVQEESTDRPLCGSLDATWTHEDAATVPPDVLADTLLAALAGRGSTSIQQLLTAVGTSALEQHPTLVTVELRFRSEPLSPVPVPEPGVGTVHDLGAGSIGVTRVALRRA